MTRQMTTDDVVPGAIFYPVNMMNNVLIGATDYDVILRATEVTRKTAIRILACVAAANMLSLRGGQAQR